MLNIEIPIDSIHFNILSLVLHHYSHAKTAARGTQETLMIAPEQYCCDFIKPTMEKGKIIFVMKVSL